MGHHNNNLVDDYYESDSLEANKRDVEELQD
jgi:hypothetical protein